VRCAESCETINGSRLQGDARTASKRLNRFLNDIGIADPRKAVHSLRHRAQIVFGPLPVPRIADWQYSVMRKRPLPAGYGEGFPLPLLKQWIDKIGF
jgi:hypothetical protein